MSVDIRRSGSLKGRKLGDSEVAALTRVRGDRRPSRSVSFNRDVHIKRYTGRQLSKIDEAPSEMKEPPVRGDADGTEEVRRAERPNDAPVKSGKAKDGFARRLRAFFSPKPRKADAPPRLAKRDVERRVKTSDSQDGPDYSYAERPSRLYSDDNRYRSLSRTRPSRFPEDTSQDDMTDLDVPNRYGSLVYLHAAAVRDIPARSGSRLSSWRDEPDATTSLRRKTKKNLTRSLSMVGPWTPQHAPIAARPSAHSSATLSRGPRSVSRTPIAPPAEPFPVSWSPTPTDTSRPKLPRLVFTGPPLERTLRREWKGRV